MNAPVHSATFEVKSKGAEPSVSYEAARSRLLDAFFELDLAVAKWLRHLGDKDAAKPLGQRLDQLARHCQLASKASTKQRKQILALDDAFTDTLALRNAVVHSRHQTGTKGDEPCIFLRTVEGALSSERTYFVVTLEEIDRAASHARCVAGRLTNYLKQASSPPRPSPV
jgi:hypothetical protein